MIAARTAAEILVDRGFAFFSGVPCSYLGGLIVELRDRYVPAAHEGTALAMAAGAHLAGLPSAVLLQNSGLGNVVNPLTSLLIPYRIPALLLVSMRGTLGPPDEVHHRIMGEATVPVLDACAVPYRILGRTGPALADLVDELRAPLREGRPAALLVARGAIDGGSRGASGSGPMDRPAIVRALAALLSDAAVVATAGYLSRELMAVADRPGNLYLQGSMGHALGVGVGLALARPDRRVVVLDGDGSAVMHLGSLVTAAAAAPANLLHLVVDNGVYESTGGQPVRAERVDWTKIGSGAGYRSARVCVTLDELNVALTGATSTGGPHLVVVKSDLSDHTPPRVSTGVSAPGNAARVRGWYGGSDDRHLR
ncbi:thiamine pyrophosphate-dependent enzyme [Micromonospora tulbaghiae]|uniref:thiamine pyrophosphate-dependent enzyme n=1 Tax=Micromonospora tulbaghiae TaxID=479978 RepID=UPI0036B6E347